MADETLKDLLLPIACSEAQMDLLKSLTAEFGGRLRVTVQKVKANDLEFEYVDVSADTPELEQFVRFKLQELSDRQLALAQQIQEGSDELG